MQSKRNISELTQRLPAERQVLGYQTPLRISVTLYGNGEAAAISRSASGRTVGGAVYLGTDILGSVRSSANELGALEDRYEYDAFGRPHKGSLESGMNRGYTGKPYDSRTGLYNYGYRDYEPATARFTTTDPVRDGNNWFAYVNKDPVNWVDPWGLDPTKQEHYRRNDNNHPPESIPGYDVNDPFPTFRDHNGTQWYLVPEDKDDYHEQGKPYNGVEPEKNNKYMTGDGHQEGVYDQNGKLVTDPVNQGTYNFSDPNTDWMGHFENDMVPYYKWGNSPDDPTKFWERVLGTYNGPIPRTSCSSH
ncbi:MAG: RHS repeat-associated core domain-containing protein [Spirochaetaceae bacterium]|jgi:RHS repeat-associated protein|nr:RHS repeat-associated core domain-containing protein [Spirochaetaceae bacterium]